MITLRYKLKYAFDVTLRRIRMFSFRNFVFIFPLCIVLNGCGYTVPNYIDAHLFKDTPPFLKVAQELHYKPLPLQTISEVAIIILLTYVMMVKCINCVSLIINL